MPRKTIYLLLFIFMAYASYSQETKAEKDSIARNHSPVEGKAIVYFLRPTSFGALIKMNIECDSVHIGSTYAGKYVYTILDTGLHHFISRAENNASLDIKLEAGKLYYIKQKVKMGFLFAETGLELADEKDGKKYLGKCKLSKDNVFTE